MYIESSIMIVQGETFDVDNESHLVYVGAGVGFAGLSASLLVYREQKGFISQNVIKRYENNELPNLKSIDVFLTVIDDGMMFYRRLKQNRTSLLVQEGIRDSEGINIEMFLMKQKCKLVHLHTNITFSKFPEKKQSVYNNQPEGEYTLSMYFKRKSFMQALILRILLQFLSVWVV